MPRIGTLARVATVLAALTAGAAQAATVVTLEAPGVQAATPANFGGTSVAVETFDGFTQGDFTTSTNSVLGSYSGGRIDAANAFGGANGSQYLFSFTGGSTLSLTTPARYFGLWWSAGSVGNQIQLLSGSTVVFSADTDDVLDYVNSAPGGSAYLGNPNGSSQNTSQPYVFLNIFADTTFDTVVLSGSNFESDNHTVAETFTNVSGTQINVIPVPATLPLLVAGLAGFGALTRRRR